MTSGFFSEKRRFEDFKLRYELDVANKGLTESYEKLAEVDQAKSQFLANVSHELRTPLTLILAPLQDLLCTDSPLNEKQIKLLSLMRTNGLRLLKLVNDLLEFVRLDFRQAPLVRRPIDLAILLPGLVDSVRHTAQLQGITLTIRAARVPLSVSGDEGRLEKVFLNLLSNAIKFTPRGKGIVVRWKEEGTDAVVEVSDEGIGISANDQERIFERFSQVDSSSTRKYQGAGIGLALARDLVEEHRGSLSVKSVLGVGSTFRVTLPRDGSQRSEVGGQRSEIANSQSGIGNQQSEMLTQSSIPNPQSEVLNPQSSIPNPQSSIPNPQSEAPLEDALSTIYQAAERIVLLPDQPVEEVFSPDPRKPPKAQTVLVVDDEAGLRMYLGWLLHENYRIVQAGDGESGLRLAKEYRPNLAVLDWMLPGMDGLALCKKIKDDPDLSHTRVIIITAKGDEESKLAALGGGADDFMLKPFNPLEVKARVENLLLAQKLEAQLRKSNEDLDASLRHLKETESQLVQSEKMSGLGTLAAGLLHEINNPLNYAMMGLNLIQRRETELTDKSKSILEDVREGMDRIANIVSDLRAFSSPSRQMHLGAFDLETSIRPALRMLAYKLGDVKVEQELEPGCLPWGDPIQISHVLMNLILNARLAVENLPDGRAPRIRVTSRREGDRALISVWDNGTGITPENQNKLFEPFFTTREVGQGMGLGLSICHTIIRNHNGTFRVDSEVGQHTQFTFDLPLSPSQIKKQGAVE